MAQINGKAVKKSMKKVQKRPTVAVKSEDEDIQECDFPKMMGQFATSAEQRKPNNDISTVKQMLLQAINQQKEARRQAFGSFEAALNDLQGSLVADYAALKESEVRMQRMAASVVKSTQQTTAAAKQKLQVIEDMETKYKQQCEEMECKEEAFVIKMADDLDDYINKLQAKLSSDIKKKQMEQLRKSLQAMQDE